MVVWDGHVWAHEAGDIFRPSLRSCYSPDCVWHYKKYEQSNFWVQITNAVVILWSIHWSQHPKLVMCMGSSLKIAHNGIHCCCVVVCVALVCHASFTWNMTRPMPELMCLVLPQHLEVRAQKHFPSNESRETYQCIETLLTVWSTNYPIRVLWYSMYSMVFDSKWVTVRNRKIIRFVASNFPFLFFICEIINWLKAERLVLHSQSVIRIHIDQKVRIVIRFMKCRSFVGSASPLPQDIRVRDFA